MTISYHQRSAALTEGGGRRPFTRNPDKNSKGSLWKIIAACMLLLLLVVLVLFGVCIWYGNRIAMSQPPASAQALEGKPVPTDPVKLRKANETLAQRLQNLAPKEDELYIVVDSALNRVYWRKGDKTLREMIASCGTGNILEDPASGRKWVFETPRGERRVQSRKADPVWMKPDWAFIEEGEVIPKDGSGRAEPGVMGDYAIDIGDSYYLHGTLYKRLLGRNVSHGCVRLGDDDIEFIYKNAPNGTRVVIF